MRPQPNVLTKLLAMLIISLKPRLLKNILSKNKIGVCYVK
jgi:hypothetical protein